MYGASSPMPRAAAQRVLGFEKWHVTGMLSSSVETVGIFLAFPVPID